MGAWANHMAARTNLCSASGQMGTGQRGLGMGVALARFHKSPGAQLEGGQSAGKSCWCDTHPQPPSPPSPRAYLAMGLLAYQL